MRVTEVLSVDFSAQEIVFRVRGEGAPRELHAGAKRAFEFAETQSQLRKEGLTRAREENIARAA